MDTILHLCPADDWKTALEVGLYTAASLAAEGFIHCSMPEQILGVANRYFSGDTGLVLLWIDSEKLAAENHHELLRCWENLRY